MSTQNNQTMQATKYIQCSTYFCRQGCRTKGGHEKYFRSLKNYKEHNKVNHEELHKLLKATSIVDESDSDDEACIIIKKPKAKKNKNDVTHRDLEFLAERLVEKLQNMRFDTVSNDSKDEQKVASDCTAVIEYCHH